MNSPQNPPITFAVIADVQYGDEDDFKDCRYRQSLPKLQEAVDFINESKAEFVVQMGDFINQDEKNFAAPMEIWNELKMPSRHLLGNHDYIVSDEFKAKVPALFNLKSTYYSESQEPWRLIYLNGNDLSFNAFPENSAEYAAVQKYYDSLDDPTPWWNGALGEKQLLWLQEELSQAESNNQQVIIFCHYPIYPLTRYSLWNTPEVLSVVKKFSCVKAWMNGHHHDGNYEKSGSCHFVGLKGMVEHEENAYSLIRLFDDKIVVEGHGRQQSMSLSVD
ncbi:MAG: metallophosphoesterase [Lentisphaeraceae bacterium]|nr:metallophosphoesterase [Lentisphaeraceae bacterium]